MGNLLLEKKNDFESANTYFNKVFEFHPDNAVALTNVGVALSKQQKYSDALNFFKRAIRALSFKEMMTTCHNVKHLKKCAGGVCR